MGMKNNICPNYVGFTCVSGFCPMALRDEYIERGIPLVRSCNECIYYEGCEDCALFGTEYCSGEEKQK